jgi:molybdate transport system substrate-binding protein
MKLHRAAAVIALLLLPLLSVQSRAAEIRVFSSTGFKAVLEILGPQFEKETGNKLVLTIAPAAVLKTQIDQGAGFDVAIVTPAVLDALAASGKVDAATRTTIARSPLTISVRAGTPKPDIATADALKRTLLAAKSIGYNGQGASRAGIEAMFAKLGIADDMKPKIKLLQISTAEAVSTGDVGLALSPMSEVIGATGVEVVGAVPAEFQSYLALSGAVSVASQNADPAKAFIKFITALSVVAVLKAKGMEPGTP